VLEVATICVQTGLNPARHILGSPCFPISANNKHSPLQSIPIHFPTILCKLTHYTNTHDQQPYCVGTLTQMTEGSTERRVRQETGWLAGGPLQLGALQTHSSTFLTQRTYSCSNFVAISSLVFELLKKCRVR
jgi:hypothetical protein